MFEKELSHLNINTSMNISPKYISLMLRIGLLKGKFTKHPQQANLSFVFQSKQSNLWNLNKC